MRRPADLLLLWLPPATLALALASGCTSSPLGEIQVPKEVKVPAPVPCVDPAARPRRPPLRDAEALMLMDRGRRTLALYNEWERLQIYAGELEAVVEACSKIPPR